MFVKEQPVIVTWAEVGALSGYELDVLMKSNTRPPFVPDAI